MLAGAAMFISRYAYAGQSGSIGFFKWSFSLPSFNFPLAGQWLMALSWLVALVIVSMPAFVKLLPRFQNRTSHLVGLTLESYLREFFHLKPGLKISSAKMNRLLLLQVNLPSTLSGQPAIIEQAHCFSFHIGSFFSFCCRPRHSALPRF